MHHDVKARYEGEAQAGGGFLLGVICGAAVGAAVGLLMAPRTGADLRGQIADTAQRFRRQASKTVDRATETVNDLVERGRDAAERGRESFEEVRANFARAGVES